MHKDDNKDDDDNDNDDGGKVPAICGSPRSIFETPSNY